MWIIWFIALWAVATIIIEYIDWDRVFGGGNKVASKPKERKKSKINWEVVWSIWLLIAIAIAASLT